MATNTASVASGDKPKLALYFDIRSGYSYFAFTVLKNSSVFTNCAVSYVPIDLYALWKLCDNPGSWDVKNKPVWIKRSGMLWAKKFSIPFGGPPEKFLESSTTLLQQTLCVLSVRHPKQFPDVIAALEDAFWVRSEPLFQREQFQPVIERVIGAEVAREVADAGASQQAKEMLEANTQTAFEEGGFGAPWFVATNAEGVKEVFFGFDHLGHVADFLGIDKPLVPESMGEGTANWRVMI